LFERREGFGYVLKEKNINQIFEMDIIYIEYHTRTDYQVAETKYDSIYLNSNSFNSGIFAVGCLIELVEAVVLNQIRNGFAIIRPPGHHAESDRPMGFCMFNNVAIATKHCMRYLNVRKVLILDWDAHFGNGTQEIFSEEADVLYVSLHRYEDTAFYPSDRKGSAEYTGHGNGRGKTVNIPWPCCGMTDADYLYAFRQVVIPIATEFNPDLVIGM
jgi:histone deacetylase 6